MQSCTTHSCNCSVVCVTITLCLLKPPGSVRPHKSDICQRHFTVHRIERPHLSSLSLVCVGLPCTVKCLWQMSDTWQVYGLLNMYPFVSGKSSGCNKCLCTSTTFVQPFTSMYKHVFLKIALYSKVPVTDVTFVWPFTSMRPHVCLKTAICHKLLMTHITFELSFMSAYKQVCFRTDTFSNLLVTNVTSV